MKIIDKFLKETEEETKTKRAFSFLKKLFTSKKKRDSNWDNNKDRKAMDIIEFYKKEIQKCYVTYKNKDEKKRCYYTLYTKMLNLITDMYSDEIEYLKKKYRNCKTEKCKRTVSLKLVTWQHEKINYLVSKFNKS